MTRFDVVIIGAGLVGAATALALRALGQSVALCDRGFGGAQASGVNYGGVRRQGRPLCQLPLAQRAHGIWPRLAQLIGTDGDYRRTGHLKLARTPADMAALEQYAADSAGHGLDLELLGPAALRDRFGWLADGLAGASLCPEDGQANPRLVAAGFVHAARRAGAELLEGCAVTAIIRQAEGFILERHQAPPLQAGSIINAAGAWAGAFAASLGEAVPLTRIYPSMIVTEPLPRFMTANIGIQGGNLYARQTEAGNCVLGGARGEALADPDLSRPTADGTRAIRARALALFPPLRHAQMIRAWSGTEGEMPDHLPVLGPSRTTPGLLHAFGFSGAGFQIAPAVGEVLAELVTQGQTATPIAAFAIDRFHPPGTQA